MKTETPTGYTLRTLRWAYYPQKDGWMSDYTTTIEIEDEGAGEFLMLQQPFASTKLSAGGIAITDDEWPGLRDAIEAAFKEIAENAQSPTV